MQLTMARVPAILLLAALPTAAGAHDIWLDVDAFVLEAGEELVVRQVVGEELGHVSSASEELPVLRDMTPRFELITEQGTVDLLAELPDIREQPEVKPVLRRRIDSSGLVLVAMDHAVIYTAHTDEEFFAYLEHEGLDPAGFLPHLVEDDFQEEGYLRTLKALVRVEGKSGSPVKESGLHSRAIGQPIELLLLENPYALEAGDELTVQALLNGRPLAGVALKALRSDGVNPVSSQTRETNDQGLASFELDRAGRWLLRMVYLAPCSGGSHVDCADADWESYWTAFSFALD